ncbi:carboxypeptidase-like regulatory domain-containing protein [Ferruginibacter lapsinanis]|uniref:carboxypeptidase-like regulatory domain-containing protein n=1 Tax=Ferruginibacter lapsinanis TaxID=563172 RepID=UPI001E3B1B58|nr:carboxypeptidase-like regulatory domain-containing protein [Ferruginibacter lapsinanis]UEG49203.1 carboxypeptidase-like regulatory domain-containing protein [Ferruginibacter lapsinanis]
MLRAVETHLNDNSSIVATIPAFQASVQVLSTKIQAIIDTVQNEVVITTGIAADKTAAKKELSTEAAAIAGIIAAYAAAIGNNELLQSVNITYSTLLKTKDDLLAPRSQNIHAAAQNNIAALAPYGITQMQIDHLQQTINNYQSKVPNTRNATAQKKTYIANLKMQLQEASALLTDQVDKIILAFRSTHPDFVTTYIANRVIIDPPTAHTQIKGTITNSQTTKPIAGAAIQVIGRSTTDISDAEGNYTLKPLKSGHYSIIITKAGYQTQTLNLIKVKLGQTLTLNISMLLSTNN